MRRILMLSSLFLLLLSGCSGNSELKATKSTATTATFPMTLTNFSKAEGSDTWIDYQETFHQVPKRVLANTQPVAELLLHLGIQKEIVGVGAVFGAADQTVENEFARLNHLSSEYIGKELALSVNPDIVIGRGNLFENQEWGVGTVDTLNQMGVQTYVLRSSIPGGTFQSVYQDIAELGDLFQVRTQAEKFITELKQREHALTEKITDIKKTQTFAYLHTNDPEQLSVYPAHNETFFESILAMVNLENAFKNEQGDVSVEHLIETNPDVLILPNWEGTAIGAKKAEALKQALLKNKKLATMKAIKEQQVYVVDYNHLFGYGYQSLEGMEKLANELYFDH